MTLNDAIKILSDAGVESPAHDARELFIYALSLDRSSIIDKSLDYPNPKLSELIGRRALREPLQYILGETGFFHEVYKVSPSVLIPRSDTEILVDFAVKNIPCGETFLDLCTGSGCIAISTLKNTENTTAVAVDISEDALTIASENAECIGVSDRLSLLRLDVLTETIPDSEVYAVLSNPPYVTEQAYRSLSCEVQSEPQLALVGGEDGMIFYKRILPMAIEVIKPGGFIAFEIGYDQGGKITSLAKEHGLSCEIIKDYSALDRVAVIRKK
jgi:release factor glutamine methyltransferase